MKKNKNKNLNKNAKNKPEKTKKNNCKAIGMATKSSNEIVAMIVETPRVALFIHQIEAL